MFKLIRTIVRNKIIYAKIVRIKLIGQIYLRINPNTLLLFFIKHDIHVIDEAIKGTTVSTDD